MTTLSENGGNEQKKISEVSSDYILKEISNQFEDENQKPDKEIIKLIDWTHRLILFFIKVDDKFTNQINSIKIKNQNNNQIIEKIKNNHKQITEKIREKLDQFKTSIFKAIFDLLEKFKAEQLNGIKNKSEEIVKKLKQINEKFEEPFEEPFKDEPTLNSTFWPIMVKIYQDLLEYNELNNKRLTEANELKNKRLTEDLEVQKSPSIKFLIEKVESDTKMKKITKESEENFKKLEEINFKISLTLDDSKKLKIESKISDLFQGFKSEQAKKPPNINILKEKLYEIQNIKRENNYIHIKLDPIISTFETVINQLEIKNKLIIQKDGTNTPLKASPENHNIKVDNKPTNLKIVDFKKPENPKLSNTSDDDDIRPQDFDLSINELEEGIADLDFNNNGGSNDISEKSSLDKAEKEISKVNKKDIHLDFLDDMDPEEKDFLLDEVTRINTPVKKAR